MAPRHGLVLHDLALTVGSAPLLRDLHLEVPGGTLTAIIGPSGAGKTTLLRAIAGLMPISSGRIVLDERDLARVPVHRRGIAMVFQEPRLFVDLDVADNVAFALRLARVGREERRRRAGELLDEVGLGGTSTREVTELSGGEQQRVSLARALAARPSLLLLDEPLAAVDPARRTGLRRLIGRVVADRDLTAVHVTHDRVEAAELGDRIALLMEGRIVEQATPEALFERPRHAVTARFLGSTNIIEGEVRGGELATAAGCLPVPTGDGPATFTIRPERVRVGSGPLGATVVETRYRGGHVLVSLDARGLRLEAHVPPDEAPVVGTDVAVDLPVGDLWPLGTSVADSSRNPPSERVEVP